MSKHIILHDENGCLHSPDENTPATVHANGKYAAYYRHGQLHRTTGPAVINDGKEEHRVLGSYLSKAAFEKLLSSNVNLSHITALEHYLEHERRVRFGGLHLAA